MGYLRGVESINAVLWGLAAAAGATLFPGLQNMALVSVCLRAGRRAGYVFSAGLVVAFTAQATLAVFFANYFTSHPEILSFLRQWAVVIFASLAAFFLLKGFRMRAARLAPEDRPLHGSPFVRGVVLALMNFLVIPYFFALSGWLLADGLLGQGAAPRAIFILGAAAGASSIYGAYARLAYWLDRRAHFLTHNINFVLGGLLAALTLLQILRLYL